MREEAVVIDVSGTRATVTIESKSHCDHCRLCTVGEDGQRMLEADNKVSASPGEKVILEVPPGQIVTTSLVVYGLPLVALVGGVVLGYFLAGNLGIPEKREPLGFAFGIAGLVLSLIGVRLYDRALSRKGISSPVIVEKICP